jgi:hypothetical protein
MSVIKNKLHVAEYIYDFSVDGGATGEINLHEKAGKAVVPVGAVIKGVAYKVVDAITSAGAATVAFGNGDDKDGYSGAAIGKATLVANYVGNGGENDAALLYDTTDYYPKYVCVVNAADGQFILTVGTAALTAGKIVFMVEYFMPTI